MSELRRFKEVLKELLKEHKITQRKLASEIHIAYQSINKWLKTDAEPNHDNLRRLSEYFDVSTDYLLGVNKAKHPKNESVMRETGLSEKSVECLRKLQNEKYLENLKGLNYILETIYDEIQENKTTNHPFDSEQSTILTAIYKYTHMDEYPDELIGLIDPRIWKVDISTEKAWETAQLALVLNFMDNHKKKIMPEDISKLKDHAFNEQLEKELEQEIEQDVLRSYWYNY